MTHQKYLIERLKEASMLSSCMPEYAEESRQLELGAPLYAETHFFAQILSLFSNESEWPVEQLRTFPAPVMVDYLTSTHRSYLNKRLPEIEQLLEQLAAEPGELSATLAGVFSWLRKNMEKHFRIEEQSLFPYVELLDKIRKGSEEVQELQKAFRDFSVQRFIENHQDEVENKLSEIKKYIVCSLSDMEALLPYRILLLKLDLLEKDLRIHARVEDEVLVPLALSWEKTLGRR
jgi:regulator of cell morphogenesis and NO signaling